MQKKIKLFYRLYLATPFGYEDMEPYTLLWQFRF